jgi:hypothetical protein
MPQILPLVLLFLGLLLWIVSLQNVNVRGMTDIGLIAVLPVTYYAALIILVISFGLAEFKVHSHPAILALHLILMVFFLHATPILLYGPDTMRYSWAWKHLGIIDYIMRHSSVNPYISFLNAYHNWPGFFVVNALFTQTAGLSSALSYARWAPVYNNLLFLGGLFIIYRTFTTDSRLIWLSAWFFLIANWIGQDYFAPQASDYFLYLVTIGILLTWFHSVRRPSTATLRRWLHPRRLADWADRLFQSSASDAQVQPANPRQRVLLITAVILLLVVITFTHQLTPLALIVALALLAFFQRIYVRSLAVLMFFLENVWLWFVARPFMAQNLPGIIAGFGNLGENVSQNLISLSSASSGQVLISIMGRALTVLIILLGGIGFLRRVRAHHFDLTALLLAVTPIPLLIANGYGGEILFRVYFFALPALAFLAGAIFFPDQRSEQTSRPAMTWLRTVSGIALSLVILVGFLFAYYGKDKQYYLSPQEVAATKYLFNSAPPGSLIISGTSDYPSLISHYEYYTYVNISQEPVYSREAILKDPAKVLEQWMGNTRYAGSYLIITRSQEAAVDMIGTMPPGSLNKIVNDLIRSGKFSVLYQNEDAVILILKNRVP